MRQYTQISVSSAQVNISNNVRSASTFYHLSGCNKKIIIFTESLETEF